MAIINKYDLKPICDKFHSFLLDNYDNLYGTGFNDYGQLGLGHKNNIFKFQKIDHNCGIIKQLITSEYNTYLLNTNNELFSCGSNYFYQLGLKNVDKNDCVLSFTKIEYNFGVIKKICCFSNIIYILNTENNIFVIGHDKNKKTKNIIKKIKKNLGEIKYICGSSEAEFIINTKNDLYVKGDNHFGNMFTCDNVEHKNFFLCKHNCGTIDKIYTNYMVSFLLNTDSELYLSGNLMKYHKNAKEKSCNRKINFDFGIIKDISIKLEDSYILNQNSDIYIFDNHSEIITKKISDLYGDIKYINSGIDHTLIVNFDNKIFVKGYNENGELGVGTNRQRKNFVELKFYPEENIYIVI